MAKNRAGKSKKVASAPVVSNGQKKAKREADAPAKKQKMPSNKYAQLNYRRCDFDVT